MEICYTWIICHTHLHASLEKTGAIISTKLHIKHTQLGPFPRISATKVTQVSCGGQNTYAAHGGRWGSVHQPGLSSVSLLKPNHQRGRYEMRANKKTNLCISEGQTRVLHQLTCEPHDPLFFWSSAMSNPYLAPNQVVRFPADISWQVWYTCNVNHVSKSPNPPKKNMLC